MTTPVESFADVATRREPDEPLIPSTENPYTAIDHKTIIATALGFEERRYTGSLSRPLTERLYIAILGDLPEQSQNLNELKYEIAAEVGSKNPERLLDNRNVAYKSHDLRAIYDELTTCTHGELQEILSDFDLCPVCDSPVEDRKRIEGSGQIVPPDEHQLCIHADEGDIVIIEHMTGT